MATLMLREVDDVFVDQLKRFSGETAGSKAVISSARRALALHEECERLRRDLLQSREIISRFVSAERRRSQLDDEIESLLNDMRSLYG